LIFVVPVHWVEMPRYFFHVRDGTEISRDPEGQILSDLEAARREAVNSAREMIGERVLHGGAVNGRTIEIAGEDGRVLATVETREVLVKEGQFGRFSDDVTKSAPVTNPIFPKPSDEKT
jgi:hypothetical protein